MLLGKASPGVANAHHHPWRSSGYHPWSDTGDFVSFF